MELTRSRQAKQLTHEELARAEEGLVRLLRAKRFPREWIERNVPDLMAQARADFAARLAAGREDETVNLLVVIGYRRATKLLDAQQRRPATTSIEDVFHLADEATPTPEEEAIERDRQERVMKAIGHLPEREQSLLALVYFDGKSIRDAGKRLGWGKSSADRHHQAALERLHEMLDRSLLSPELAVPAYIAARHWHHSPWRGALRWSQGAIESAGEALLLGGSRYPQAAETGSAAATNGAGRAAAGVCGAAVALCLTGAASGVIGPGVGALGSTDVDSAHRVQAHPSAVAQPSNTSFAVDKRPPAAGAVGFGGGSASQGGGGPAPPVEEAVAPQSSQREAGASAPPASTRRTVEEFGVEGGGDAAVGEPVRIGSPASEAAPAPSARPASAGSGSSGPSGSKPSSSSGSAEFGM